MTLQLEIKPDTERSLRLAAQAHNMPVEQYALSLLESRPDSGIIPARNPAMTQEEFSQWLRDLSQFADQMPQYPDRFWTRDVVSDDDRG